MSNDKPFKMPSEFEKEEDKTPVSARVYESTKDVLEKAAVKEGQSLSWLIGQVLESYADWLRGKSKR